MSLYKHAVRPLLFALPAETSHELARTALHLPLPWSVLSGTPEDQRLEVNVYGLKLRNPVGLAAGFDKNCAVLSGLEGLGFGYLVGGTVTAERWAGNARPRIGRYVNRESLVNAMGLPNEGAVAAAARLHARRSGIPIVISIGGHSESDLLAAFEAVIEDADGVELNVSCPNIRWGRDSDNEALLRSVLPVMRSRTRKPILVKIPPYSTPVEREAIFTLVKIARDGEIDGITAFNTVPIPAPEMSIGAGGLSGRAVSSNTRSLVRELYVETRGELPINACGGIFDAEDALACIRAGASTVQIYTGFIYEGPRVVRRIASGIIEELRKSSLPLTRLIGVAT